MCAGAPSVDYVSLSSRTPYLHLTFTLLIPSNFFSPLFFVLLVCAGAPSGDGVSSAAHNPLLQPYPLPPSGHAAGASPAVSFNRALTEP